MAPLAPKNRLALVSPGIGKLSSAVTCLLIGLVALNFNRSAGQSLLATAAMFGVWGVYTIYRGVNAPHQDVACPHCSHRNEVLTDVLEFNCANCRKPIKRVRKPT